MPFDDLVTLHNLSMLLTYIVTLYHNIPVDYCPQNNYSVQIIIIIIMTIRLIALPILKTHAHNNIIIEVKG